MTTAARRALRTVASVVLLALLVLPAGCGDGDAPAAGDGVRRGRYDASGRLLEGTRSRAALPNIVVLVLDTLRADAIRGRDGAPPTMPRLAAWAQGSVDFVDASAPAAWTAPCVTSMLTGLPPSEHGVQGHIAASPLAPSITTLAEILQAAGYATTALTGGGWVSRAMGLGQGFDTFVETWRTDDPRRALQHTLAEHPRERPLFLLLHTYEAHDPYGRKDPPEGHDDPARVAAANAEAVRLARAVDARPEALTPDEGRALLVAWRSDPLVRDALTARLTRERAAAAVVQWTFTGHPADPSRAATEATLRERYDRGVAALDAGVERTLAALDAAELPGRTVVFVVTDHGEAFGENGALGHGRWLIDPITRILLLVRAPGRLRPGVVRGSCGGLDLTATVLDLAGLPIPAGTAGRSLIPMARGREAGHPVLAEEFRRQRADPANPASELTLRVVTVRTERAKLHLLWDPRSDTTEATLFDLAADPAEAHPLPVADVERFGAAFADAVARARAHVATFRGRADNHGNGAFQGE